VPVPVVSLVSFYNYIEAIHSLGDLCSLYIMLMPNKYFDNAFDNVVGWLHKCW